jgi:hypothetical protein
VRARIKNPALTVAVAAEAAEELGVSATHAGVSERARYLHHFAMVFGREG